MNYKLDLKNFTGSEVVLKRTRAAVIVFFIILLIFGLFFLLIGLGAFVSPDDDGYNLAFLFTGIGLWLTIGAILVKIQIRAPESFIFDNNLGHLKILEKKWKEGDPFITVPYSEIKGFSVGSYYADRRLQYRVIMEKKDGASWAFFEGGEKKAKEFADHLTQKVDLNAQPKSGLPPYECHRFEVQKTSQETLILWKKNVGFGGTFFFGLMIVAMAMVVYGIRGRANTLGYAIALGFVILMAVLFIGGLIYLIKRRYVISITQDRLDYGSRGGFFFKGPRFSRLFKDIASLSFMFTLGNTETAIYILNKEEQNYLRRIKEGKMELGEIVEAVMFMIKIPKIEAGALFVSEKMVLEQLLKKVIKEENPLVAFI